MAAQVVGTVVGAVVGGIVSVYATPIVGALVMSGIQFATTAMDDLLFAGLDSALTNKDSEDIWADFGKKTANVIRNRIKNV